MLNWMLKSGATSGEAYRRKVGVDHRLCGRKALLMVIPQQLVEQINCIPDGKAEKGKGDMVEKGKSEELAGKGKGDLAEKGVRAAVSVARSGGRFTCITASRGACSGLARAVELSTARTPSLEPSCTGEIAPSVHEEVESGVLSASHIRARVLGFRASSHFGLL